MILISEYPFLPNAEPVYPYDQIGPPIVYDHFESPPPHAPPAFSFKDKLWNLFNPFKIFSKPYHHTPPTLGSWYDDVHLNFQLDLRPSLNSTLRFSFLSVIIIFSITNNLCLIMYKDTILVAIHMIRMALIVRPKKWVSKICSTLHWQRWHFCRSECLFYKWSCAWPW